MYNLGSESCFTASGCISVTLLNNYHNNETHITTSTFVTSGFFILQ